MNWLKSPYPFIYEDFKSRVVLYAFVFSFVALFIYIFRPFDIEIVASVSVLQAALMYASTATIVSLLAMEISLKFFPNYCCEKNWTIGKEIFVMNNVLLLICIGNYFVGREIEFYETTPSAIFYVDVLNDIWHTYSIGIFPVALITTTNYIIKLNRNLSQSEKLNQSIEKNESVVSPSPAVISIESSVKSPPFELNANDLLFVMADGNYVEYHYLENGETKREIQRNTLTNVEAQISAIPSLFRTHRAYIVNVDHIEKSSGNAQGYQLKLHHLDHTIPVSRKNLQSFDELINSRQN